MFCHHEIILLSSKKAPDSETPSLHCIRRTRSQTYTSSDSTTTLQLDKLGELELDQVLHARAQVNTMIRTR